MTLHTKAVYKWNQSKKLNIGYFSGEGVELKSCFSLQNWKERNEKICYLTIYFFSWMVILFDTVVKVLIKATLVKGPCTIT